VIRARLLKAVALAGLTMSCASGGPGATPAQSQAPGTAASTAPVDGLTSSVPSGSAMTGICDHYPAASDYVAISETAAVAKGATGGVRVVERDGVSLPILKNLDADRVNLVVENGLVTHACRF
jgi:hypothetical protein